MLEYSVKSSYKVALDEYDQKSALFQTMTESKSFNNHPAHKALYHTLMESLLADEEGIHQVVVDLLKQKKRQHDDQCDNHDLSSDQLEWNLWHAPWLSDQLEWNLWHAPWLSDQLEWNLWYAPWLSDQLE
ncbi:hypothetical protein Tco_1307368 [Tanacetum coccineum]